MSGRRASTSAISGAASGAHRARIILWSSPTTAGSLTPITRSAFAERSRA
ncbi:MAG TPA: hypothetical protein VGH76_27555 [Actinomycetospora sp.]